MHIFSTSKSLHFLSPPQVSAVNLVCLAHRKPFEINKGAENEQQRPSGQIRVLNIKLKEGEFVLCDWVEDSFQAVCNSLKD